MLYQLSHVRVCSDPTKPRSPARAAARRSGGARSATGVPEPPFTPTARRQRIDDDKARLGCRSDEQLRDPVAGADLVGGVGIGVHEDDLDLTPEAAIDESWSVQTRDAVASGKAASRKHETRVAGWERESDPGRHERPPPTGREDDAGARAEVRSRITWVLVGRQRIGVDQDEFHVEHRRTLSKPPGRREARPDYHATVLVWMDLEMTGLDPDRHVIVEIATLITNDHLDIVAEGPDLVIHASEAELAEMDDVVRAMHTSSGLLDAIAASTTTLEEAGRATLEFIHAHVPAARKVPLCGNSIGVDRRFLRRQLPEIEDCLHYRSIDVSTVKELCKRWNPALYGKAPKKSGTHRALDDIRESVAELAYYRDHFFRMPGANHATTTEQPGATAD